MSRLGVSRKADRSRRLNIKRKSDDVGKRKGTERSEGRTREPGEEGLSLEERATRWAYGKSPSNKRGGKNVGGKEKSKSTSQKGDTGRTRSDQEGKDARG